MPETIVYTTDATRLVREWDKGTHPSLDWLQKAVGGYIEIVPGPWESSGVVMYANENGLLNSLPPNMNLALDYGVISAALGGIVRGNVVVLKGFDEDDEEGELLAPDDLGHPGEMPDY